MTRKVKRPLVIILGLSAAGAAVTFTSKFPISRSFITIESPIERRLHNNIATIPSLSSSKFIVSSDNNQTFINSANTDKAIQTSRCGRTILDRGGAETQLNDTQSRNAVAMISTTIRIRAPTNGNPAKIA